MSYMDLMKFTAQAPEAAPQASPEPSKNPAPLAQAPGKYGALASFAPPVNEAFLSQTSEPGAAPESALPESPLSLIERAQLGWVRTPEEQIKLLKGHFDDVKLVGAGEGSHLVVKKDKQWMQVDPSFEWKFSGVGATAGATAGLLGGGPLGAVAGGAVGGVLPNVTNKSMWKDLPGDAAQFVGEYGLRTVGALAGTAAAVVAAPATLGVLGLTALGTAAAGVGATAAEGVDLASRKALNDPNSPGATPYKNAKEVEKQLGASFLFGVENELGGKLGGKVLGKAFDSFASVLKSFVGGAKEVPKSILKAMGAKETSIVARLDNPLETAHFDKLAAQEAKVAIGEGPLTKAEDAAFEELHQDLTARRSAEGAEFGKLLADPEVKAAKMDHTGSLAEAVDSLVNEKYLLRAEAPSGAVILKPNPKMELGSKDFNALRRIITEARSPSTRSYEQSRMMIKNLSTVLDTLGKADGKASDIFRVVTQLKVRTQEDIVKSLPTAQSNAYASVMNRYAEINHLFHEFGGLETAQRKSLFLRRLQSPERNNSKEFVQKLLDAGVDQTRIMKMLRIQAARESTSWFQPGSMGSGWLPKPGSKIGAAVITGAANFGEESGASAALPYLAKGLQALKSVNPIERSNLIKDPRVLQYLSRTAISAAQQEESDKQALLNQAGIK